MKLFISFFCLFICAPTFAYIPRLPTILAKTVAKNGGKKALIIQRTVNLKDENLNSKETWYIAHADLMKVVVEGTDDGKDWKFEILYKKGKRFTPTVKGTIKTFKASSEFYEPLLHYRSSKSLLNRLIRLQVLPTWAPRLMQGENKTSQKNFIQLDRYKGTVTYALGSTKTKGTLEPPQVWLQQDSFNIQKIRLPSQVEVEFSDYRDHDEREKKELTQPEAQVIHWKRSTVNIQTTSIKVVDLKTITDQLQIKKGQTATLPSQIAFKEFYSRFR